MKQESFEEFIEKKEIEVPYALPEGWRWKRLGDKYVAEINPSKKEIRDIPNDTEVSFIPMDAVDEIQGKIEKAKVKKLGEVRKGYTYFREGDVIFAKITPCMENGKCAIAENLTNKLGFGSTEFHVIRPSNILSSKWIHLYLRQQSIRKEAAKYFTGSVGQQRVPEEFLENLLFPLPPLEGQKRIIARIEELFSRIEEIQKLRKDAFKQAKALMPSALHEVFSKADEKGWRCVKLGEVGKYINGRAFKPGEWEEEGLPIIRIQNLTDPNAPFNFYSKPVEQKYYVKNGDLLISWSATLDAFIWNRGDAILNQHIFRVEEDRKLINKDFLFYVINYILYLLKEETHGSTMKHITKKKFENILISLPSLEEQERVIAYLDKIQEKTITLQKLQEEIEKEVEKLRESILHKAFMGKL